MRVLLTRFLLQIIIPCEEAYSSFMLSSLFTQANLERTAVGFNRALKGRSGGLVRSAFEFGPGNLGSIPKRHFSLSLVRLGLLR